MAISLNKVYRTGVYSNKGRRIGFVREVLFHPSEPVVVGFVVQRPRLAMVYDVKDRYLAFDRAIFGEEISVADESKAWDGAAAKRLGLDWEQTVVWQGMPVRTEGGADLGRVRDARFDSDGRLTALGLTGGAAADAAVGVRDIAASLVRGFDGQAVVVSNEATRVETTGGAALAAGKGYAVAKDQAIKASKSAAAMIEKATDAAEEKLTGGAAKAVGKKAGGWLRSVRDEFSAGMKDSDKK